MRRVVPYFVAALLGVGAAALAACGGSSTAGGVPQGDASVLKGQLEDVRQRVDDGQCDGLSGQLRDVDQAIDGLPQSVDARLVSALRRGSDRLQRNAVDDCNANRLEQQAATTTTPPETTTTPPDTTTTPPETTTTPPATTTTPPPTTTTPPTETIVPEPPVTPEPAPVPPPPVVSPGGGTPPEIGPP